MVEHVSGKIIFTASLLTFQGGITVPGYAASKGTIRQLTMARSNEWAGKGVQVNALAPGYIAPDNTQYPDNMNIKNSTQVTTESHSVALTADCAIFGYSNDALRVLLERRAVEPFKGFWVLPGGAMQQDETLLGTANRILKKLVNVENVPIRQVGTYSGLTRHPIRRVVTTSYYALVSPDDYDPIAREHLDDVMWCSLDETPELGFDHREILDDAYETLKTELRQQPLAFQLLPGSFTLKEAQEVYESILGEGLDRRNFRRKILAYDFLINTEEKKPGVKGGPELYRIDNGKLENHLQ